MHITVQSLNSEMVSLLLEKRGDPDLINTYGASPLNLASSFGLEAAKITKIITKWRFQFQKRFSKRIKAVLTTKVLIDVPLPDALHIADIVAGYIQQQLTATTIVASRGLHSIRQTRPRASKRRRKGLPLVVVDE
mmetsp:Transcript_7839/g.10759  ORF Transcript_7839/g.10759 Transcript_7839/m.10759 type:complete len:135 (-) Transcript_7839:300-704(-)